MVCQELGARQPGAAVPAAPRVAGVAPDAEAAAGVAVLGAVVEAARDAQPVVAEQGEQPRGVAGAGAQQAAVAEPGAPRPGAAEPDGRQAVAAAPDARQVVAAEPGARRAAVGTGSDARLAAAVRVEPGAQPEAGLVAAERWGVMAALPASQPGSGRGMQQAPVAVQPAVTILGRSAALPAARGSWSLEEAAARLLPAMLILAWRRHWGVAGRWALEPGQGFAVVLHRRAVQSRDLWIRREPEAAGHLRRVGPGPAALQPMAALQEESFRVAAMRVPPLPECPAELDPSRPRLVLDRAESARG